MAPLLLLLLFTLHAASDTLPSDISALRTFKSSITPSSINPWSCIGSWNFASAPCRPANPAHFTCGIECSPDKTRITAITLDPAGYAGPLSAHTLTPLSALAHLDLFDNKFSGPIPDLSSLNSLQTLVLASNSFTGTVPATLPKSLHILDISRNALSGSIPNLDLPNLYNLDLSFNKLTGVLPNSLPPNLVTLSLRSNAITGFISRAAFQNLKQLETVELGVNRFRGRLQGWFFLLPSLQQVDLTNNTLTRIEAWAPGSGLGEKLVAVDVSYNRIGGVLPAQLAEYPALVAVSARGNRLVGGIPWVYYGKKKGEGFRRLFLDGNFLNGKAPEGFFAKGEIVGSFGDNCLDSCPGAEELCAPRQKPVWVCKQVYGMGEKRKPGKM